MLHRLFVCLGLITLSLATARGTPAFISIGVSTTLFGVEQSSNCSSSTTTSTPGPAPAPSAASNNSTSLNCTWNVVQWAQTNVTVNWNSACIPVALTTSSRIYNYSFLKPSGKAGDDALDFVNLCGTTTLNIPLFSGLTCGNKLSDSVAVNRVTDSGIVNVTLQISCTKNLYNQPLYQQIGILDDQIFMSAPWLDVRPWSAVVNSSSTFELGGFRALFVKYQDTPSEEFWLKVSASPVDCFGEALGGGARKVGADGTVTFTIRSAGWYRICFKRRTDWQPFRSILEVTPEIPTAIFGGSNNCKAFLDMHPEYCGCYFKRVITGTVSADYSLKSTVPLHTLQGSGASMVANFGCCVQQTQTRTQLPAGLTDAWGVCAWS